MENNHGSVRTTGTLVEVDSDTLDQVTAAVLAHMGPALREVQEQLAQFITDAKWRIEERLERTEKLLQITNQSMAKEVGRLESLAKGRKTQSPMMLARRDRLTTFGTILLGALSALAGHYAANRGHENRTLREAAVGW